MFAQFGRFTKRKMCEKTAVYSETYWGNMSCVCSTNAKMFQIFRHEKQNQTRVSYKTKLPSKILSWKKKKSLRKIGGILFIFARKQF